jgi:site-specific DNA recombinase
VQLWTWDLACLPEHRYDLSVRTAGQAARVTAGIYCRISLARFNDTTKVDDQERICRDLADRLGWDTAGVYSDNSLSAWRKDRKRPAWDQMLADVDAGKITGIVVYHGDRLVRQPFDLEQLLNLAESKGIKLASPTGTRDLDDPNDRFVLRILTAQACMESDNTSRRRKGQYERWGREGRTRPGGRGGRAFGFATDGVTHLPADRCIVATRREESEADVIREMARRVLAGEGVGAIARDVSARGWLTPAGAEFSHGTVRKMLARPRLAGLMPDGASRSAWDAVLDRPTWERVRLVLSAKATGFGYATNARRWLLSGIAVCGAPHGDGECGAPMRIKPSKGRGAKEYASGYACTRKGCGKAYRSAPLLDAYVSGRVVRRLGNPFNPAGRPPAEDHAAEWAILQRERDDADALLADYTASAGRARSLLARLDAIDARMAELRERDVGDSRARLLERYAGITREDWEGLDLGVRRALVAACYRVTVLPASGRGPGFRPQDVRMDPAG